MAKTSVIEREKKRLKKVAAARTRREGLKETIRVGNEDERDEAIIALQKLPRDTSPARVTVRCSVEGCGRPRGVYRKFGLCRIHFRERFCQGEIPGTKKASW